LRRRAQRGLSLIFTLIALVLLMLISVALVRSVDTMALVMGNLGFKQDTTNSSSNGTSGAEAAIAYITTNYDTLIADIPTKGYYASSLDDLDPTGSARDASLAIIDWDEDNCASAASGAYNGTCKTASPKVDVKDASGKVVGSAKYLIARLCSAPGSPTGLDSSGKPVVCSKPPSVGTSTAEARGEISGKSYMRPDVSVVGPYFRIVVRAVGGRNTVSFTETIVHF
jgi:hypothetical protein